MADQLKDDREEQRRNDSDRERMQGRSDDQEPQDENDDLDDIDDESEEDDGTF